MSRRKFIAGNWKMFTDLGEAKDLAKGVADGAASANCRIAVCPPFPWLNAVAGVLAGTNVELAAQNCHQELSGAYTGEVSASMLKAAGCSLVIIGHSERRHGLNESDSLLNQKTKTALAQGLEVIFCIGELLSERQSNETESVLDRQLTAGLEGLSAEHMEKVTIAYEPVWAIGTGQVATTEQAQTAHAFIRQKISELFGEKTASDVIIQYGGSVKPENAAGLLAQPDIDGALVGGASLKADSFLGIIAAAG